MAASRSGPRCKYVVDPVSLGVLALACSHFGRDDADVHLAVTSFGLEGDHAVYQREEGVVSSAAYVLTGMELGSALTNENIASEHCLATKALYAASLTV
jgi:hypothetical protein